MKCTKCQGEWTPPANKSFGKCPFCKADILQMLNEQADELSTEVILANMLQAYGTDLLQNQQRLTAMIADLLAHDHKTKRLLLLSVRENTPTQLAALVRTDNADRSTRIFAIQHRLVEDAFIKEEAAEQIVSIWTTALGWENEENENTVINVNETDFDGSINDKMEFKTPIEIAWQYDESLVIVHGNLDFDSVDSYHNRGQYIRIQDNSDKFKEELAKERDGSRKWGFLNKHGEIVVPFQYDSVQDFNEGLAIVELNRNYGAIDKTGKVIIEIKYQRISSFKEGFAYIVSGCKYGFIDKQGKLITPVQYEHVGNFNDGLAWVKFNDKYGFINKQGKMILPLLYDDAISFKEGLALVKSNGKFGFIDKLGKIVVTFKYDRAKSFSEGLAMVESNGKCGFVDKHGEVVIPIQYDEAKEFIEDLAAVKVNGRWGFVNKQGRVIIEIQYDSITKYSIASYFNEGVILVKFNGKYGLIDKLGKEIVATQYETYLSKKEKIKLEANGKFILINKRSRVIYMNTIDATEYHMSKKMLEIKRPSNILSSLFNNQIL